MLMDEAAKAYQRCVRYKLQPHFDSQAFPTQCQGHASRGTDFCAHLVRAFQQLAKSTGQCHAVLFLDIVSAFYSAVRQLICLPSRPSDEDVARLCYDLGFAPGVMHEIAHMLEDDSILIKAGVSKHLAAMVDDMFDGTWFSTDGARDVVRTRQGTMLGVPLADLIYNVLMSKILRDIDDDQASRLGA